MVLIFLFGVCKPICKVWLSLFFGGNLIFFSEKFLYIWGCIEDVGIFGIWFFGFLWFFLLALINVRMMPNNSVVILNVPTYCLVRWLITINFLGYYFFTDDPPHHNYIFYHLPIFPPHHTYTLYIDGGRGRINFLESAEENG